MPYDAEDFRDDPVLEEEKYKPDMRTLVLAVFAFGVGLICGIFI